MLYIVTLPDRPLAMQDSLIMRCPGRGGGQGGMGTVCGDLRDHYVEWEDEVRSCFMEGNLQREACKWVKFLAAFMCMSHYWCL